MLYIFNFFIILTTISYCRLCFAQEVTNLPGLSESLNFKHYSGYLKASSNHYLHYWFVESQGNPKNDPLMVWMNGGPGCSSLDGLLSELGPFLANQDGATLRLNPYAWNHNASVLFLEAPAGVGFSYSKDGNVTTSDDQTSAENYAALKDFFAQYPDYKNHDFYITGESYAGIYVPTLAVRVVNGMKKYPLKLKGVAIGNGMLDFDMNTDTLIEFGYHHGLIDQKTWDLVQTVCCHGCTDTCDFHEPSSGFCNETLNKIVSDIMELGLNVYDLYRDCFNPPSLTSTNRFKFDLKSSFPRFRNVIDETIKKWPGIFARFENNPSETTRSVPPCLDTTAVTSYLNRKDVRLALHIPDTVQTWEMCSTPVGESYKTIYHNMRRQFKQLLNAGIKIMVYNGDTDMACNFLMGQKFVASFNRQVLKPKHPWYVDKQIAGYATNYKGVDFVTIKGTGHMVPQWKPPQAFKMISSFLANEPL